MERGRCFVDQSEYLSKRLSVITYGRIDIVMTFLLLYDLCKLVRSDVKEATHSSSILFTLDVNLLDSIITFFQHGEHCSKSLDGSRKIG